MIGMLQTTEISFSGGGLPWELVALLVIVAFLVIGVIVWLFRSVRKNINADNEWHYEDYALIKSERPQPTEASPMEAPVAEPEMLAPRSYQSAETPQAEPQMTAELPPPQESPALTQSPIPLEEPATPRERQPVSKPEPEPIQPISPTPPASRNSHPPFTPEPIIAADETISHQSSALRAQPSPDEAFFHAYEHEVQQEHRQRTTRLAVVSLIALLVAVYFLVFPVQEAVNSVAAKLSQQLGQLFEKQSTVQDQLTAVPQLDVVQEMTPGNQTVIITGHVRNISSETLSNLFAEIALVPVGVELTETRLVTIEPQTLPPNQEGTYRFEIKSNEFSKYQLARIVTADKKEITFKLSLAFPSGSEHQP